MLPFFKQTKIWKLTKDALLCNMHFKCIWKAKIIIITIFINHEKCILKYAIWRRYSTLYICHSQKVFSKSTAAIKINHPGHNIRVRMYWTIFLRPTVNGQQNIFEKIIIEVCGPHLYASFGTFCAQIGQLFETQCVIEVCLEIDKSLPCPRFRNSSECLKYHYVASNWPIWTQNLPTEA